MRTLLTVGLVITALAVGFVAGFTVGSRPGYDDTGWKMDGPRNPEQILVLDGDTLLVGAEIVRFAGIDAPELPPRSKCWAEAALATHVRQYVENKVSGANLGLPGNSGAWRVTNRVGRDASGHVLASLTRDGGDDLADDLRVYGYAALTTSRTWDWCGPPGDLRNQAGPGLWYPPDDKIDARAVD